MVNICPAGHPMPDTATYCAVCAATQPKGPARKQWGWKKFLVFFIIIGALMMAAILSANL